MTLCLCSLANTRACRDCPNRPEPFWAEPNPTPTTTLTMTYIDYERLADLIVERMRKEGGEA